MRSFPEPDNQGLPSSDHCEITILGAMILDPVAVNDAISKLQPADFNLDSHRKLFTTMRDMLEKGQHIDTSTLSTEVERRRELDAVGGRGYIFFLTEGVPRNFNIEAYCVIVKEKSMLRSMYGVFSDGATRCLDQSEDARDVMNDVEAQLSEIADTRSTNDLRSIEDVFRDSYTSIDQIYSSGREITGIETHFTDFDRMTSGLQNEELIIIAARPSMGKTAWAINIAQNAALHDRKIVAVFSLEMSKRQLFERMVASEARVNARKMQSGFVTPDGKREIHNAIERLMESRMFIDDTAGITIAEMRARARRLKQQNGKLDLVVVDYLQLMTGNPGVLKRGANRTEEVSSISRGLKALAKELKCPVVALSQLSRASEKRGGDNKPILSDLRESGSIEQDADVVAFIHREEYYDRENEDLKGLAEIIIAKQRNGPTGIVNLIWLADYTLFANAAKEY